MMKARYLLPTLAALALGGLAHAQQSTEAEAGETANPEAGASAEAGESGGAASNGDLSVLDTGEPVGAAEQEDQTYIRSTHGDWAVQCLRVEEGPEPCQMYQLLKDENDGSVAEVSLFKLNNGGQVAAGGTFVVPLETLLTQKLTIQVDSGQAKRYDYSFCTQIGCYARVGFTADDVAAFKRGKVANVSIVPALAPDQKVTVGMSLSGFTAAFEEITELENRRQP